MKFCLFYPLNVKQYFEHDLINWIIESYFEVFIVVYMG